VRIAVIATAILVAYNLLVAVARPDAMLNFDAGSLRLTVMNGSICAPPGPTKPKTASI
jgi:hypothetical protein